MTSDGHEPASGDQPPTVFVRADTADELTRQPTGASTP